MQLWDTPLTTIEVHPTFFYESLWNLIGLLLILFVISKGRRFDGENTWFYFLWYGLGRSWIEGLRTDSLYLFDWTIMGQPIRVSQALSIVMVIVAVCVLVYQIGFRKHSPDELLVNQVAAAKAAELAAQTAEEASSTEAACAQSAEELCAQTADEAEKEPEAAADDVQEEEQDDGSQN